MRIRDAQKIWILWIRIRMQIQNIGKKSQRRWNQGFSYYFLLMMEGSGTGSRAGSVLVSNGSRCGSRTPKNMRIQQIRKWILLIRIEMRTLQIRIWMRIWIPITASRYVITILNHYFLTKFWPNSSTRFQIWHGRYNRSDIVCTFLSWLWICS